MPAELKPYLAWATSTVDGRPNGLLFNGYDAALGHYVGPHRDNPRDLLPGTPIVTVSLGSPRLMRFRLWKQ
ncbi:MAG: hypothetical protein ACFCBW_05580 [Candidatus Competibacterales bacterium]